ncbi:GNAT family N-acetyltransferase [Kribbella sancticallisti]|uniref:GNAT family N-acetyltransferase n=1 Tax=Kribbella sancticallisti TaxID=460087 RepID=A0ABP4Q3I0_9ACTN
MDIRPAVPEDAEAVSALRRATFSYLVMSAATARYMIAVQPPAARVLALVAVADGEIVGWGSAGLNTWTSEAGQAGVTIYVHPEHRGQGIGGALAQRLHEHLGGIGAVRARTFATAEGVEFAKKFGYDGTRQMHYAGVDPRELPERPAQAEGIELVTMDQLDPRQAYAADAVASLDEPGDSPTDAVDYDDWLEEIWHAPGLDKALSVAAMAGDEVAAFAAIETDGDRAWSAMTGSIPAYRGRGLAKLAKWEALRRCADAGIVGAFTSNDDENGPMLAVNNWLGYRRVATQTGLLRKF